MGKTRWHAYNFMLTLPHQKLYMRNLNKKNSHKEKSTMYRMFQYHPPKNPYGENGWYDIILCQYCLIKNFLWETLKGKKTHTKKRVQYDVFNKLLIRETRDSPPETCKPFIPMYTTHMKCGVWCTLWISLQDYHYS